MCMSRGYMACSRQMSIGVANKKFGDARGPCTWRKLVGLIARKLSSYMYLVMDGNEPAYYIQQLS